MKIINWMDWCHAWREWIGEMMSLESELGNSGQSKYFCFYDPLFWSMKYANKNEWCCWHDSSRMRRTLPLFQFGNFLFPRCSRNMRWTQLTNSADWNWLKSCCARIDVPRCRLSDFSVWLTEFAEWAKTSANWAEVTRQDLYLSLEKYDSICNWFARWAAPVEQFKCIKVFKFNWIPELIHLHTSPLAKLCHNLVANCNQSGFHSCGQLSRPINLVRTMCECEMTSFAWTNKCRLIELITFENDMNRLTEMNEWTNVFKCSRRITRNYRLRLNSFHERRMTRFALEYSVFVCFGSVGRLINIILFEMCHSRHCHASCHTMSGMHAFALSQTRYTFSTFRI